MHALLNPSRAMLVALLFWLPGCYLSHERAHDAGMSVGDARLPGACRFTVSVGATTASCSISDGTEESCAEARSSSDVPGGT